MTAVAVEEVTALASEAKPVDIAWHSGLPIYASANYLETISPDYGWVGGYECGELRCLLPYSIIRKAGFRLVRFPVQTISLVGVLHIVEERRFLNGAVTYFRSLGVDAIIPATFNTLFRTYPDDAIIAPFGSYVLDLTPPEDVLWENLHRKHRNVIRNARKRGVVVRTGADQIDTAFRLVRESFMRSAHGLIEKTRVDARMNGEAFRRQILALGDNVRVLVGEYEGVPQSCAVVPFSQPSAYYMHGGNIASPLTGTANLLQWDAICQCRKLGVRSYDFFGARVGAKRGSKVAGIMRFKERFGGKFVNGYMWKVPFRPVKYRLYSLAARVRSGGDVVDQERHKLRRLAVSARRETQNQPSVF